MKKSIVIRLFIFTSTVLTLLMISGCEKNPSDNNKKILGTWISTDSVDTIEFRTDHDLYKTVGIPGDHFNYSVSGDSMTIQYNGVLYIFVQPTNHHYKLTGDILTIDLEHCYGFRNQTIRFTRK